MGQVVLGGLLETRSQPAESLEIVKEHLDEVPRLVRLAIEPRFLLAHGMRENYRLQARFLGAGADGVGVVACVRDDLVATTVLADDRFGDGRLVLLPGRDFDVERAAFRVGEGVDLRGESTSRPPQCITLDPPFPPAASWWARTTEASMMTPYSST